MTILLGSIFKALAFFTTYNIAERTSSIAAGAEATPVNLYSMLATAYPLLKKLPFEKVPPINNNSYDRSMK